MSASKSKRKARSRTKTVYVCGVDWQHEIGHAHDGNLIYPSIGALKQHAKCWEECGIVALRVTMQGWRAKQDFSRLRRVSMAMLRAREKRQRRKDDHEILRLAAAVRRRSRNRRSSQ